MPVRLHRHRLPRRLGAMLLILSVLATTLGWAHPPCDMDAVARPTGEHAGMSSMSSAVHGERHSSAGPVEKTAPHDCDRHGTPEQQSGGCPMVAHCASGFTVPPRATGAAVVTPLQQPDGMPLSPPPAPSTAPEAPPPRA